MDMKRRLELDAARGLMLVWMTTTHLPTALSAYSNQPFGFVSASEGFIFLSALFTGLIYWRMAERAGYLAMTGKLWMRTLRLYGYHALLLAFAFLVAVPIASHGNRPALHNLLDFYFAVGPTRAVTEAALLIYRPPLLDILPMYIIFLLLTPVALSIARRIGWRYMLSASALVWAFAQFGLRERVYDLFQLLGVRIPLNEMGSFDLWGWQLCWILGVWCGTLWAKGNWDVERQVKLVTIPAAVIAFAFLGMRCAIPHGLELGRLAFLFDKWHLGLARIIDFACVAVLLIHFQRFLKPLAVRPLVMLGQSSLQVFCVHLLFCFGGLTLLGSETMLSGWTQAALFVGTFAAMLGMARIVSRSEEKAERVGPQVPQLTVGRLKAVSFKS
jgi:hypothetical protein